MTLLESLSGAPPKTKSTSKKADVADPDIYIYDQDKAILYALAGKFHQFFYSIKNISCKQCIESLVFIIGECFLLIINKNQFHFNSFVSRVPSPSFFQKLCCIFKFPVHYPFKF